MYKKIPFKIIAALDANNGIGKDLDLLFSDPVDMAHFKKCTIGQIVIMGRATFESMGCTPLKHRVNIVVTSLATDKIYQEYEPLDGLIFVNSFDMALQVANVLRKKRKSSFYRDIWVIGGGKLYTEAIKYADTLVLTKYKTVRDADTFFPEIDKTQYRIASCRMLEGGATIEWYYRI